MTRMDDPTILVPIDISDPSKDVLDTDLIDLLHPLRIVLLGYYPVPDQASPEHLRDEYESEATARLEETAELFVDRGGDVEAVLVFTRDRDESINRVGSEYDCDAVLSPGEFNRIEQILVPLRGGTNLERIVLFVGELLRNNDASVTLFHAVGPDEEPSESEFILRGAADRLEEAGIEHSRIEWKQSTADSAAGEIITLASEFDLVVIGESEPSLRKRILGNVSSRLIDRTDRPLLIIRDVY